MNKENIYNIGAMEKLHEERDFSYLDSQTELF